MGRGGGVFSVSGFLEAGIRPFESDVSTKKGEVRGGGLRCP